MPNAIGSRMRWIHVLTLVAISILASPVWAQDSPSTDSPPSQPSTEAAEPASGPALVADQSNLAAEIAELKAASKSQVESMNIMWVLIAGFIVMIMQPGFALVETGFTRAKNVAHTMSMNFMIYALAMLGYWVCGFAIQFGGTGVGVSPVTTLGDALPQALNGEWGFYIGDKFIGLMGTKGFFLGGDQFYHGGIFTLFLFQMVFMGTTATVPTGAMAERWKFSSFIVYGVILGAVIYPIYGNWVWGGGWLAALGKNFGLGHGHVDFAGSSVVHLSGGVLALIGAKILGPRYGKYNSDGSSNAIPPHNIPMAVLGTFILAFGWFGFNAGSTLAATDAQMGIVAVNTMLASMSGAIVAMAIMWFRFGKPDPSFMCNGMLAGLVAVTAPCAFVDAWAAVWIGVLGGCVVVFAAWFVEEKLKIDDPVGAVAVHGFNGTLGIICLGLFANGKYGIGANSVSRPEMVEKYGADGVRGLFYGDPSQLGAQCIGIVACVIAVGIMGYIMFKLIDVTMGLRSATNDEIYGLDIPEMGVAGYQGDIDPEPK